eukprot:TRINITY_DN4628_c1_g1_i1.p1 TRINITY_DN4628_c1_g1~~TRINITY_DN4628_c1_g1_i1.p1  ORF type:complete len:487 (-),score=80.80 TRINITY_DN4628_c1_g1_i1:42-1502(-)
MERQETSPQETIQQLLRLCEKEKNLEKLNLNDSNFASFLDSKDTLAPLRSLFHFPQLPQQSSSQEVIYLCGNSLGLMPKSTTAFVQMELNEWAARGVEGHFEHNPVDFNRLDNLHQIGTPTTGSKPHEPWYTIDENLHEMASRVVGALPLEVCIMNSLSVNLHLMMVPFYKPTATRNKILIEEHSFPSDLYAVQSQIKFHGHDPSSSLILQAPRKGEEILRTEDILETIEKHGSEIALILFSGIQYYTGQFFDIQKITEAGHKKGCLVGWDLAHAVGNVALQLHDWNVDWAVWCNYKYMNGGPGTIGGCFVHERHAKDTKLNRFAGWWGHNKERRFNSDPFDPIPGAFGFRLSNPPVLQCAALQASLRIFDKAGINQLRKKSEILTGYLEMLITQELGNRVEVLTPKDWNRRGCQLSLRFKGVDIEQVFDKLRSRGVICDVRKPDVMRASPAPLYNSFEDVRTFVVLLKQVLTTNSPSVGSKKAAL